MTTKTTLLLFLLAVSNLSFSAPLTSHLFQSQNDPKKENLFLFSYIKDFLSILPFINQNFVQCQVENRFLVPEINQKVCLSHLKFKDNSFILRLNHLGYSKFGMLESSIGYARKFGKSVSFSLDFLYLFNHVSGYDSRHSLTFRCSLWGKLNSKWSFGVSVYNPAHLKYGGLSEELIPVKVHLLMVYAINEKVLLIPEVTKTFPGNLNIGVNTAISVNDFQISNSLSLKGIGMGLGFFYKQFLFHLDTKYDYRLGISPTVQLTYFLPKSSTL
ncbi:MAG: hypothetical protein CVU02_02495 [Bacteroidetes bacterium HGW-Bacteroidetes-19]|nr:MAG: hypothetical protein CVU04_04255 [Bacteroidetes bacterium HGW-Bacteroidetes-20]PKP27865.1 MAG: hypothetical protein CVU02_02495 [Bacteroidetes bacterium HGW-Bacteroidetes-19]